MKPRLVFEGGIVTPLICKLIFLFPVPDALGSIYPLNEITVIVWLVASMTESCSQTPASVHSLVPLKRLASYPDASLYD